VSTPRSRARWLRGALVGASSAVVTIGAHTAAGGVLPQGSALVFAMLVCATVGAFVGSTELEGRHIRMLGVVGGLCAAQLLGHMTMAMAGGHHDSAGGAGLTASMVAAHAAAAMVLGIAITAVEYLYVVCVSVLCWLRLFAIAAPSYASSAVRWVANVLVVQPVLLLSGLGMRAPPAGIAAA
jgi:hypothetical protein